MSESFAELLGYQDCGLQAILYLLENTDIDLNSPVVVEIVKLLISKMARTSADDRSSETGGGLNSGQKNTVDQSASSTSQEVKSCLDTQQDPRCMNGLRDGDASSKWSQERTRSLSGARNDDDDIGCDEDRMTDEEDIPKIGTANEEDKDDELHEFGEWLTRLANRHPQIARTLCEVAELIDEVDEQ